MKNKITANKLGNNINAYINGKLYKKTFADADDAKLAYQTILEAEKNPTDANLKKIFLLFNEVKLDNYGDYFDINPQNGLLYLKGLDIPILDTTLIDTIKDYVDNNYPLDAIANFTKLLHINPDVRVRKTAFNFIKQHDFALTKLGYMVTYKRVALKTNASNYDLAGFVTSSYLQVKKWKTQPRRYVVYVDNATNALYMTKSDTFEKWDLDEKNVTFIGNLADLHENVTQMDDNLHSVYEPLHTRGQIDAMDIVIGKIVRMDRTKCDSDPSIDCSYGLHVGATKYVNVFGNKNSPVLVCLVNPAHIVAVPDYDHSKMRVSEYFPIGLANFTENGNIDIIEESYFESDYLEYEISEMEKMYENALNKNQPIIGDAEMPENDIKLEKLRKLISDRLNYITQI